MTPRPRLEPLRYQVRTYLLDLFKAKQYKPGDKIPTESELSEMLQVGRSTLREGLHLLEEERIIRSRHGSGRYLLSYPSELDFDMARLQSVTEMLADYDIGKGVKVLNIREEPASAEVAVHLAIEEGAAVVCIERTRSVGDVPVIYSIDIIEKKRLCAPFEPADFQGSLLNYLKERCDILLDYSHTIIKAVPGSELLRMDLEFAIDPEIPWILLIQTNYDPYGEPIIYSRDYHRSDYISFHVRRLRA
jgi:GntR family transcriptional regulator